MLCIYTIVMHVTFIKLARTKCLSAYRPSIASVTELVIPLASCMIYIARLRYPDRTLLTARSCVDDAA